ncbi:multidrug transporter subunit MdtA, partial [Komagataeibacter oboediens]|nr:multidrug transporter subunit MdtA [Komagataeibacter oboediens]
NVKTGHANNTMTVVTDGVKDGERVVTDGVDHLRDGVKVTIPDATAPGAGSDAAHGGHGKKG